MIFHAYLNIFLWSGVWAWRPHRADSNFEAAGNRQHQVQEQEGTDSWNVTKNTFILDFNNWHTKSKFLVPFDTELG